MKSIALSRKEFHCFYSKAIRKDFAKNESGIEITFFLKIKKATFRQPYFYWWVEYGSRTHDLLNHNQTL